MTDPPLGPVRARVVLTCWDGPRVVKVLRQGEPDPTQDELDALLASIPWVTSGMWPTARIIELAFRRPDVPTVNPLETA